ARALCPRCQTCVVFPRVDITGVRKIQRDLLYPFRMRLQEFPNSFIAAEDFDVREDGPAHEHRVTGQATVGNTHDGRTRSVPTFDDGTNSSRLYFRLVSQDQDRRFCFRANSIKAVSNGSAATF